MLIFILILVIVVSVIIIAFSLQGFRNPRREWDRKHGSEMKGGEPTAEALAKIQRNAVLAMIFGPIAVAATGIIGYIKVEQQDRVGRALIQQGERNSPQFKRFGKLAKVNEGMTVAEVEAIMGPGQKANQNGADYLWWHHIDVDLGTNWRLYVLIQDGKVQQKGKISSSNTRRAFFPPPRARDEKLPPMGAKPKAAADDPKDTAVKKELELLRGTWTLVSQEKNGKQELKEDPERFLTFAGHQWSLVKEKESKRTLSRYQTGVVRLVDIAGNPKSFDLVRKRERLVLQDRVLGRTASDRKDEVTYLAIYSIEGHTLRYCHNGGTGKERPKEFRTIEGDGLTYSVWKRGKAAAEKDRPKGPT